MLLTQYAVYVLAIFQAKTRQLGYTFKQVAAFQMRLRQ